MNSIDLLIIIVLTLSIPSIYHYFSVKKSNRQYMRMKELTDIYCAMLEESTSCILLYEVENRYLRRMNVFERHSSYDNYIDIFERKLHTNKVRVG